MSPKEIARPDDRLSLARAADELTIVGAAQHNLADISLTLPKRRLIVFCGVSGSGKSSLAFDTLFAEGQRRYVESLSTYARQFLGQMDKPVYERISGLSPTIAIEQKAAGSNPRSTVGTTTEIYDHLRLLFARTGEQRCPTCGDPVGAQEPAQIVSDLLALPQDTRLMLLAPLARARKGTFTETFRNALKLGFVRARVDGDILELQPELALSKNHKHDVDLVIDRVVVRSDDRQRLTDSVETALEHGHGRMSVAVVSRPGDEMSLPWQERSWSQALACERCSLSFSELTPQRFSFNSPLGACEHCNGLGFALEVDVARVVPDASLSVRGGAIRPWANQAATDSWTARLLDALATEAGIDLEQPWREMSDAHRELLLSGATKRVAVKLDGEHARGTFKMRFEGILPQIRRRWGETQSAQMREWYGSFFAQQRCAVCDGRRLRPESCAVEVAGQRIWQLVALPVTKLRGWFDCLKLKGSRAHIASEIVKEIRARLGFLDDVGLGYLTLDRGAQTLSGGESQRIRLAAQLGSELSGVLYILDEPSIGLHPRDTARLVRTLGHLRDLGNTVLVVEHDEDTIRAADHIVDFGPGAGRLGGHIVAQGSVADIEASAASLTGAYLTGRRRIEVPTTRRSPVASLRILGATENNLHDIDVTFPIGCLTVVTGVSGAGKSTLVSEILLPALLERLHGSRQPTGAHRGIEGVEHLDKVIEVDQKPIGRTPRSCPATYTKLWDLIRTVFAGLPDARLGGYGPGRFSFNVAGGRCEHCKGDGMLRVEMHFLADVFVPCEVCGGKRFNEATLTVRYKGRTIAEVLELTVDEAADLFRNHPPVARILSTLQEVGLGYLSLGQTAPTLSGGEAQRVKLSRELARPATGRTLYVLDEPSTGLHFDDIGKLLGVLQRLVDRGNTVIIVEHEPDIVMAADHIVDLGPEGGSGGGEVVATGTPEEVARVSASHTGRVIRERIARDGAR